VFEELAKFGELENLNVCDNLADHLVGNVYAKFRDEEDAARALAALQVGLASGGDNFWWLVQGRPWARRQQWSRPAAGGGRAHIGLVVRRTPRSKAAHEAARLAGDLCGC
jgi:hypothetical protein